MGVLLSVLPGDIVLHAQMAVETLGGRENPGSHDGPGRGHMHGSGEEAEEEDPARLPVGEPAVPQLVDLQILPVRNDGVNERCGSNVHDESFLRRRVPHVRRGRDPFFGERPGRPSGPDDFHISQDDEVHLPQVRRVRRGGDARLHMHTAVERRQREDLRFPVVLVHDPRRIIGGRTRIQVRHNRVAADARVPVRRAVPADQTAGDRQHRAPVQARRLDAVVRARRQRRLGRVPGRRARSVAPAGVVPQQELDGGEDGGRVTRKPLSSVPASSRPGARIPPNRTVKTTRELLVGSVPAGVCRSVDGGWVRASSRCFRSDNDVRRTHSIGHDVHHGGGGSTVQRRDRCTSFVERASRSNSREIQIERRVKTKCVAAKSKTTCSRFSEIVEYEEFLSENTVEKLKV